MKLSLRIAKAAKALSAQYDVTKEWEDILGKALTNLGVEDHEVGIDVLEGDYITFEEFEAELTRCLDSLLEYTEHNPKSELAVPDLPPIPRIRLAWSLLKGTAKKTESPPSGLSELIKTVKPMGQWTNVELLEKYSKEGSLQVHEELAKRSKNRFVIIFNDDETVNAEVSLDLIRRAREQDTPQVYKLRTGELREVYRVGDFPMQVFYECPTHRDVLLLDGYCEECCDHWDVSDTERNTLLRLIVENEKGIDIYQYREKSLEELKKRFPKTYLLHKSLKEEDNLPRLKRKISKPKSGDPFRVVGTHRVF